MNRILLIQTAFLGDVILATPVVSELHRLYPNAHIDVLVKKGNESLLCGNPKIQTIITFDKSHGKYRSMWHLIKQFRRTKYDLVINLHRFASSGLMAGLSGGKQRFGFKKNPMSFLYTKKFDHVIGDGTHEVARNLSVIRHLGAEPLVRPELYPSKEDFESVHAYQKTDYICIAPASVWYTKQLPKDKWVELLNNQSDVNVMALGGPGDIDLAAEILDQATHLKTFNLSGKLSLLQSAALMKGARHNYVNDSGPLHLASAMNAPVTAFFCSTIPDFGFGPLSEDSAVRQVANLPCRPCGLHGHKACPQGHFKCGLEIDVR